MRRVKLIGSKRKAKPTKQEKTFSGAINKRIEMIQALVPIGLMAVSDQFEEELVHLTGEKYNRHERLYGHHR